MKGADRLFWPDRWGGLISNVADEVAGPARNAVVSIHPAGKQTNALEGALEEASHGAYCSGFRRKGIPGLHSRRAGNNCRRAAVADRPVGRILSKTFVGSGGGGDFGRGFCGGRRSPEGGTRGESGPRHFGEVFGSGLAWSEDGQKG